MNLVPNAHHACERASAAIDVRRFEDAVRLATGAVGRDPSEPRGHALLAQARDPELYAIYRRLQADRKSGAL